MLEKPLALSALAAALGVPCPVQAQIDEISTDSRTAGPGCLFVAIEGETFDGHRFAAQALERGAVCVVAHKPVDCPPERVLMVPDTKDALIAMAGVYRQQFEVRTVGVTGSVGKTTTKEFLAQVLSQRLITLKNEGNQNNEIGVPKTLFGLRQSHRAAVIEMGMTAPHDVEKLARAARPEVGVITNIGVSHIGRLGSRENILRAKLELADCLPAGAPLLLCGDNDLLRTVRRPELDVIFYGIENPENRIFATDLREEATQTAFTICYDGKRYPAVIPVAGRHNVCNALCAFGVGLHFGLQPEEILRGLAGYQVSGMRQRVVEHHGITVVEDCYNASPDSMRAALSVLGAMPCRGRRIAVLADMLELGEWGPGAHRETGELAAAQKIDHLFAYGELARYYMEGARALGEAALHYYPDRRQLTEALVSFLRPGDLVWLKASHGMHLEETVQTIYEEC